MHVASLYFIANASNPSPSHAVASLYSRLLSGLLLVVSWEMPWFTPATTMPQGAMGLKFGGSRKAARLSAVFVGCSAATGSVYEGTCLAEPSMPTMVVIPYVHSVLHHNKKAPRWARAHVIFLDPSKKVNPNNPANKGRVKKHATNYVLCRCEVSYKIPTWCGSSHIGQTGRCLKNRMYKHTNN